MGKMSGSVVINVRRQVYQVEDLNEGYGNRDVGHLESGSTPMASGGGGGKRKKNGSALKWSDARTVVPAIDWLFTNYNWSEDFFKDFVAGFTVAVLNIPQGMAYAMLGNVEPTVGLYMAILPVIVYSLLGTSRHVSMGSFSVVCLMAGKVVNTYANAAGPEQLAYTATTTVGIGTELPFAVDPVSQVTPSALQQPYTPIEVATAVTLVVGLVQVVMYVFRLGAVCTILSETLVSGFTAGAAVHVVTSQMKELLGLRMENHNGLFQIVLTYYDIGNRVGSVNYATVAVSCFTVALLLSYNVYLKAIINRRLFMPMPIELITIVVGTALFQFTTFSTDYKIKLVSSLLLIFTYK